MKPNRSIPASTIVPILIYPEVREAVAWLGGAVIVGDVRADRRAPRPGEITHSVLVRVDNAHAHCERAREHGARIIAEPADYEASCRPSILSLNAEVLRRNGIKTPVQES
jgi:hypothetical protein